MTAYFPTTCPKCHHEAEPEFHMIGLKSCPNCGSLTGCVPISTLPTIDSIKRRIWDLCGHDLNQVKQLNSPNPESEGWLQWWEIYLKARKVN